MAIRVAGRKQFPPAYFMDASEKNQQAIRRSTRLPLEVPVLVTSLDPASPFSERCNTTLVNAHGCGLIVPRSIAHGVRVRLEIVSAKRHTTARVAEVVPLGGDPETWLIGLELDAPGNFWGIEYAPADWKIEENAPAAPEPSPATKNAMADAKPVRPGRWRLTDISAGACYLETGTPFQVGTPVVLSIRFLNAECVLDGVVRVSHPNVGMGVEFTGANPDELSTRVQELVGRLSSNREAPKIFVGRKEGLQAKPSPPTQTTQDGPPDALLELVRSGPTMTAEQFFSDLQAQRLGNRRDPRIDIALPVLLSGTDVRGRPLDQRVITINVSRRGALLDRIHGALNQGDIVSLARLHKKEQFHVAWVGEEGTPSAGQIGVSAVDPNTAFWEDVLKTTAPPRLEPATVRDGEKGQ
ncbi:MAG TPA: PilZ domain-containing protein [Terriglobales bacterium]|nr:PilZ domain-containing protein [Terriglobales bacterium]